MKPDQTKSTTRIRSVAIATSLLAATTAFQTTSVRAANVDYIGSTNWQTWGGATKWRISGTTTNITTATPTADDDVYYNWQDGDHYNYTDGTIANGPQVSSQTFRNFYVNASGLGATLELATNTANSTLTITDTFYVAASDGVTARTVTYRGDSNRKSSLVAGNLNVSGTATTAAVLQLGAYNATSRALMDVTVSGATTIGNGRLNLSEIDGTISLGLLNMTHADAQFRLTTSTNIFKNVTVNLSGINSAHTGDGVITLENATIGGTVTQTGTLNINTAAAGNYNYSGRIMDNLAASPGAGSVKLAVVKRGAGTQELSGANTHTGGTNVEEGTLRVSGSLAASGAVSVAGGAKFETAAALAIANLTLTDGAILGFDLGIANTSLAVENLDASGGAFVIDFGGTGLAGQAYVNLFSVSGTGADFGSVSFVNFGSENLSGTLTVAQLGSTFTIAVVPEPAAVAAIFAALALLAAFALTRTDER
ncbi:MAG: autotransporter-associated beta strand repeat-containing protein [Opitutaceae bacterium]|jgi:autotransporter-associated beta strand protein|nr:autotransporter-associated beta strand repeat-containing protein [Opitutaceae bacterium]